MPLIPVAAFLAGALLSLLLPIGLLIALSVWYVLFVRGVPGPADGAEPTSGSSPLEAAPGPDAPHPGSPEA